MLISSKEVSELIFSSLIVSTVKYIQEYVEIWDEKLQIDFANAISQVFQDETHHDNLKELYNLILKFCMKIISTDDKNVN